MGVRNRLKEIRMREYMMKQNEFCKLIKISQSTYSAIESNKIQGNIENVLIIAKALNRRVEDIWYLED